ncbi:MAG: helix-turn-helix domain-containing protein [Planctomycetes bacterium]|nr:helix-turn-helix domain-containing protein [Phycisphaerae bacterium]NBB95722.1 helix-turn-helix domain-containing protein [Planctomycetota bacterium]
MAGKQADDVMTIDELAAYLKLSNSSLYHFARARKVPGVKIGQQWRFQTSAIDEWMRTGTMPPQPAAPIKEAPKKTKNTRKARWCRR